VSNLCGVRGVQKGDFLGRHELQSRGQDLVADGTRVSLIVKTLMIAVFLSSQIPLRQCQYISWTRRSLLNLDLQTSLPPPLSCLVNCKLKRDTGPPVKSANIRGSPVCSYLDLEWRLTGWEFLIPSSSGTSSFFNSAQSGKGVLEEMMAGLKRRVAQLTSTSRDIARLRSATSKRATTAVEQETEGPWR